MDNPGSQVPQPIPTSPQINGTDNIPQPPGKPIIGYIFGGLSFIPLLGVLFGIIAIIVGIVRKSKLSILLGLGGILLTFVLYGSLFYFGTIAKTGPWADLKKPLTQQILTGDAGALELYKKNNGKYPDSLEKLGTSTNTFPVDGWGQKLYYKVSQDGQSYILKSPGSDGQLNTPDDISAP